MAHSRLIILAASLVAVLYTGCKSADKTHATTTRDGRFFAVSADSAAFFRHGPRPGRVPDLTLPKDTVVKLIRPSFGYSKIELVASGEQGYILSEEIKPASNPLIAAATAPPNDSVTAPPNNSPAGQFNIDSDDPRLIPPPEQLPNPDFPPQAPTPGQ